MSIPDRIGPYRPLRRIGAGGMGTVYFAYHPATGAATAVKVLNPDHIGDASYRARFAREVTLMYKVAGPYLVPLTDADPDADIPWLAMPYVPGNTLERHVQTHGPLTGANLVTFAAAVAHALSCIHAADVAHRDLKPANVILAVDGPRVVDFGIAHHLDATAITATSVRTGTPTWMAPEQLTHGVTTQASDIFAWGMLIAYAASGANPFGAPTGISHRIEHAAPDLSAVPDPLLPLVTAALHKAPEQRPTAVQLVQQATALFGEDGTAIFPTLACTRVAAPAAEPPTVVLDRSRWDIPAAETDLTGIVAHVPSEEPSRGPQGQTPLGEPACRPPASAQPPLPPEPGVLPAPARQPKDRPRRRAHTAALSASAVVIVLAAASAVALTGGDGNAGANPPSTPSLPATARPVVVAPTTSGSASPGPSTTPGPTSAPMPTPTSQAVSFFGGMQIPVPSSWTANQIPQNSLTFDDGTDTKYAMTLSPADAVDTNGNSSGGLAIEWAPGLVALTGDAADPNGFGIFSQRFASGPMDPTGSGSTFAGSPPPAQDITSPGEVRTATVGGVQADAWTVQADVLPDYNHNRTTTHQVWFLRNPRYVIYTFGTLTSTQEQQVAQMVANLRFTPVAMPLDCADAVNYLDATASGGNPPGNDPSQSCINLVSDGSNATGALDPGTMTVTTEPGCLALVYEYTPTQVYSGSSPDYTAARRLCGLPGKS